MEQVLFNNLHHRTDIPICEIINLNLEYFEKQNNLPNILNKVIIHFPFKSLYYLANNLNIYFNNINNHNLDKIIISIIDKIISFEGNSYNIIEGIKSKNNGVYKLSCIYFDKFKYKINNIYYNDNIFLIDLKLFY